MLHYYQNRGKRRRNSFFISWKCLNFCLKLAWCFSDFKNTLLSQISRSTIENWYRKSRRSKSRLRSQVLYAAERTAAVLLSSCDTGFSNNFYWAPIPWAQNSHPKPSSHFLRRRGKQFTANGVLLTKQPIYLIKSDYNFCRLLSAFPVSTWLVAIFFLVSAKMTRVTNLAPSKK